LAAGLLLDRREKLTVLPEIPLNDDERKGSEAKKGRGGWRR
jgi:hypothetical protein